VADRWPACGEKFVALPVALYRHAGSLGLDHGDLRLIGALSSFDFHGKGAFPGDAQLAKLAGCSTRTVERRRAKLEALGLLEVRRARLPGGTWAANHYGLEGLRAALARLVKSTTDESDHPTSDGEGSPHDTADADHTTGVAADHTTGVSAEVEEREVEEAEEDTQRAREVLDLFNERAGTAFTARVWLSRIVDRVREHPELGLEQHRAIIDRNFAAAWWNGSPSPAVLFRDPEQFERAMHQQERPRRAHEREGSDEQYRQAVLRAMGVAHEDGGGT